MPRPVNALIISNSNFYFTTRKIIFSTEFNMTQFGRLCMLLCWRTQMKGRDVVFSHKGYFKDIFYREDLKFRRNSHITSTTHGNLAVDEKPEQFGLWFFHQRQRLVHFGVSDAEFEFRFILFFTHYRLSNNENVNELFVRRTCDEFTK